MTAVSGATARVTVDLAFGGVALRAPPPPILVRHQESFNGAKSWVKELQRRAEPNVVIALAGNKADLKERAVEKDVRATGVLCFASVTAYVRLRV